MAAVSSSHTFQGSHIGGQARVHLGDHHGDITNNETHHHYNDTTTSPEEEERKKAQSVLTSLYQDDPSLDRARLVHIKGNRVAGTCEWVLKDDKFQSLVHGDSSTLWISGGPGLGKTMLSVYLTQYLENHFEDSAEVKVVYYFCNYVLRGTSSTNVLRALLWQILQEETEAASSVFDKYFRDEDRAKSTLSAFVPLWAMLETVLQKQLKHQRFVFVLDGLDECDQESVLDLSAKFANIENTEGHERLQTVVVSRNIARLRGIPRVRLDPDHEKNVRGDVRAFVAERVAKLSYLDGYNETFQAELQETLLERAAGTFLWIGFAMLELYRLKTCYAVLQAASSFPMGLSGFYSRMLHQVDTRRRSVVARLLQWVALAQRSLQLVEVAVIVDLTPEAGLSEDQAVRDIIAECGPMLRITAEEIVYDPDDSDDPDRPLMYTIVTLVHQSARDYLLRAGPDDDAIAEAFRIVPSNAHLDMTRSCLAYLRTKVPRIVCVFIDDEDFRQHPLLQYARSEWISHAKHIPSGERLLWKCQEFYRNGFATQRYWYEEGSRRHDDLTNDEINSKYTLMCDPLSAAIRWGVKSLVETVLEDAKSAGPLQLLDIINGRFCPDMDCIPICAALYVGGAEQQEMVELVLSHGADVTIRFDPGWTPLHYACRLQPRSATIKLLLDAGADINARSAGRTPLDIFGVGHGLEIEEKKKIESLLRSHGAKLGSELEDSKPKRLIRIQKKVFGRVVFSRN